MRPFGRPDKTAAYQSAMPLHHRAMAAREATPLTSICSGACPHPPTPQRAGAALTQGMSPQALPAPGGFALARSRIADLVEVRIFSGMRDRWTGDVQIVAATKDSRTEYWVAATRREEAVAAVQQLLVPGWTATLADRRISPAQIAVLHQRPNGVRKLRYVP